MSLVNVMWSSGAPFSSVHKVHHQIVSQLDPGIEVKTWFLKGRQGAAATSGAAIREWGFSSHQLKARHFWRFLKPVLYVRLRKALIDCDARVVLLDGLGASRVLLPVLKTMPHIRAVVVFHGATRLSEEQKTLFQDFPAERLTLAAVSMTLASSLKQSLGLPVQALRSALDPELFCLELQEREQARRLMDLPSSGVRVMGAVGRLVADKGFDYLLDAFSQTLTRHPDLKLVIVGEGPDRRVLEGKIRQLNLADKVFLPGHKPGLAKLYRGFDWVVIPSREEGLGLVLQEAVIAGVPVLSSDLEVFREQLGEAGRYVPVADVPAWVAAIDQFAAQESESISASQYRALAPERVWLQFCNDSRALLAPDRP
jgi:glycosyltransferase involved in cell wall biosynthesis